MGNYNSKSEVELEIFAIFQHKVERLPHLTHVTEMRHIQSTAYPESHSTKTFIGEQ